MPPLRLVRSARGTAALVLALTLVLGLVSGAVRPDPADAGRAGRATTSALQASAPTACTYTANRVRRVAVVSRQVGRAYRCALVYNDAAPRWRDVRRPWFMVHVDPAWRWDRWVKAQPGRRLVIAQSLIPDAAPRDWRRRGARGQYDRHFRALGRNLVRAGLGGSVIRLAHEGDGEWFRHRAGTTRTQQRQWARYWARAARALKRTPGSRFTLDLTVSAGAPHLPMKRWYPGDDVVDVIGIDMYDQAPGAAPKRGKARWRWQRSRPGSLDDLAAFARRHHKRISVPEWGLAARSAHGLGDNPAFVRRMMAWSKRNDVLYQGYWNKPGPSALAGNPRSLKAYRAAVRGWRM